ncbi:hypothetical protein [Xenorhabdus sp. KJ12.1]|uniref:hypothetical protein n=1 Tax=Xenorhabdus sp. KJ12.1 TaxID=1851571 RepID=UPI000C0558DC|nr:hypothetical protein [Xenorhabdus sp. KJ12.1]PHM69538.1 hypothetical protein Xekj_02507 [Xenorhabdus sp. KJ12.1]
MNFIDFVLENHTAILAISGAFFGGALGVMQLIHKGVIFFKDRNVSKNMNYLDKYSSVLSPESKRYISDIINAKIIINVTEGVSKRFINLILKLKLDGVRSDFIHDIKYLKNYMVFISDIPEINVGINYKIARFLKQIVGFMFIIIVFIMLPYVSDPSISNNNDVSIGLWIGLMSFFEFYGVYLMFSSPSDRRIRKINEVLSGYPTNTLL